jgi:hypothetical protein
MSKYSILIFHFMSVTQFFTICQLLFCRLTLKCHAKICVTSLPAGGVGLSPTSYASLIFAAYGGDRRSVAGSRPVKHPVAYFFIFYFLALSLIFAAYGGNRRSAAGSRPGKHPVADFFIFF